MPEIVENKMFNSNSYCGSTAADAFSDGTGERLTDVNLARPENYMEVEAVDSMAMVSYVRLHKLIQE